MKVGELTVDAVRDGRFACPIEFEYPDEDPARFEAYRHLLEGGTDVVNELGGFLIRGAGRVVLVDLGFGPAKAEGWDAGEFMHSLDALGVKPEDVTDVVFTHLHFDHIGWTSVGGQIMFPNATHHAPAADWPHFTVDYEPRPEELEFPDEMLPENKLAPIADSIVLWSEPGEIIPGVEVISTPGHTPGHSGLIISSNGESVLLAGDIAHHQAEFVEEGWQGVADIDEDMARRSRRALAERLAESGMPFVAAHFRNSEWGRVVRTGSGYAWEPHVPVAAV
jgi:glyoxylase-like metal-dependent hydrolase (beta-lactamase superfamily II)